MAYRQSNELPEVFNLIRLRDACRNFVCDNDIKNADDAYYLVHEQPHEAFGFITSICNLIGYRGKEKK